jgi:hypothetical protein
MGIVRFALRFPYPRCSHAPGPNHLMNSRVSFFRGSSAGSTWETSSGLVPRAWLIVSSVIQAQCCITSSTFAYLPAMSFSPSGLVEVGPMPKC